MSARVELRPVDLAEVTAVVENSIDTFLVDDRIAKRPIRTYEPPAEKPRAEHGLSLLLRVTFGATTQSILYDAGLGRDTAIHNLDQFGVSIKDLRAIVLSHGHLDHYGGLEGITRRAGVRGLPLVLHPDAWKDRKVVFPNGNEMHAPPPSRSDLVREGIDIVEERGPSLLLDGSVLVTGQVDRETDFERGFPLQQARDGQEWMEDRWVWDDQAVIVNVRGKGLLVLTACSHSGVINILRHARRVTGIDRIHGVIGGLHLSGAAFEPIIDRTVAELAAIAPTVVVPGHCTGWKAIHRIARHMPDAFIQTSVGTRFEFGGE